MIALHYSEPNITYMFYFLQGICVNDSIEILNFIYVYLIFPYSFINSYEAIEVTPIIYGPIILLPDAEQITKSNTFIRIRLYMLQENARMTFKNGSAQELNPLRSMLIWNSWESLIKLREGDKIISSPK